MDDSQSQSLSSVHEDQTSSSVFGLEGQRTYRSGHWRDANSGAGSISARYKLMSPAKLPISRSPCITIPPGLSPTSFLESPVLLSNVKAEPSPTTGSFLKPQLMNCSEETTGFSSASDCSNSTSIDERKVNSFEFKPHRGHNVSGSSAVMPMVPAGMNHQKTQLSEQVQAQCPSQSFASLPSTESEMVSSKELNLPANDPMFSSRSVAHDGTDSDHLNKVELPSSGIQASQSDNKDIGPCVTAERSSDDGYNWRKYGQKVVKGSEFPRSYYKCTHPNCEVKKIFERSHDGHTTEIVYKGKHDHPKPQPARRFTAGAIMSIHEKNDKVSSLASQDDMINAQISPNVEPNGNSEVYLHATNDDSVEGDASQLNNPNDELEEDGPFSKRRKLDGGIDVVPVVKPIREPRVVVQTVSEVDILDDGYRWRKYGQKVVRGNPNPRSYYKCTNVGCPVRKHVERASHDPKAVITTYEGKHNHDVPSAKSSSHDVAVSPATGSGLPRLPEQSDSISLDLGVGIRAGMENKFKRLHQILDAESLPNQVNGFGSNFNVVQVNGGIYGSRENWVEGHSFQTPPLNHSSNSYPQNLERILLGP
ncbi:hypothetical protein NMG60_11002132 [Bertholletia excelsa]